ncbi:Serine/threonine protein kinase [Frankia canadensis]|uniref:Serine/threonine protein kinase n=1 Tax=Frankia canadensis TaxID=1836972 RepID=A0A2I2KUR1_9ACTN|nr:serine/threonine-protein kinase [Frankia canadensis]SNQ49407.1 Serine/threonine protein kinase [Frankia canadensis]SOU56697.1 Serine/threonine protein kinase [Frankia canadensis]
MIVDRERVEKALPGYTVAERLGSGAFGLVLAGEHRRMGRPVAIKVMEAAGPEGTTGGFADEARVLAGLDHPHVLRVHDYVEAEGLCLVVMELLAGGTLARRQAGMRPEEACAVGLAVAAALGHAHDHGVLHRDIKADNVLFATDGTPKVSDFGIAKLFEGTAVTASNMAGTPMYMAPEQIQGGRLGPSTDLYALGALLYRLLAGRPPFDPKQPLPVLWNQHLTAPPPPMAGVAPPLAAVVLRALEKAAADRHPDAAGFALDLAHAATEAFGTGWTARAGLPLRLDDVVRRVTDAPVSAPSRIPTDVADVARGLPSGQTSVTLNGRANPTTSTSRPVLSVTAPPLVTPMAESAVTESKAAESASLVAPQRPPAAVAPSSSFAAAAGSVVEAAPDSAVTATPSGPGTQSPPPSLVDRSAEPGPPGGRPRRHAVRLAVVGAVVVIVLAIMMGVLGSDILAGEDRRSAGGNNGLMASKESQGTVTTPASAETQAAATPTAVGSSAAVSSDSPTTAGPSAGPRQSGFSAVASGPAATTAGPAAARPADTGPGAAAPPANPGQQGPAGPGGDPNYVSGSETSVPGCAGWVDFNGPLYGTLSAGNASCSAQVTTVDQAHDAAPGNVSLNAANYARVNSKPPSYFAFGYYRYAVRICIWNQNEPSHKECSPTYINTQGKVTRG